MYMSAPEVEIKTQSTFHETIATMPKRDYEALAEGLGEKALRRAREVASATGSVLAELPGEFSPEAEANIEAYIRGELDIDEAVERTVAYWRKRAAITQTG